MGSEFAGKFERSLKKKREADLIEQFKDVSNAPKNLEEFLGSEGLIDWPYHEPEEGALNIGGDGLLLGTQEDIASVLREAAQAFSLDMMEALEDRMDILEKSLRKYADEILTDQVRESRLADRLFHSPSRTFMTEVSGSDAVKSHSSARGHKSVDFAESVLETRKKTLEYCTFPGFRVGELVELPGQMEAPPILHRVTNAQDFNPGFKKFWKKLFLSEASVGVMQDMFWWIYLNKFSPPGSQNEHPQAKNKLFDRIADSFVALFTSVNSDVKDKFLSAYPDCIAQAIYTTFFEAFPESAKSFDDEFKQDLVNMVHEFFTGLKPVPCTWKNWDVSHLEQRQFKLMEGEKLATVKQMLKAAALNKEAPKIHRNAITDTGKLSSSQKHKDYMESKDSSSRLKGNIKPVSHAIDVYDILSVSEKYKTFVKNKVRNISLDLDAFAKVMDKMGSDQPTRSVTPRGMLKDKFSLYQPKRSAITPLSQSKSSRVCTKLPPLKESHQIGPGPDYERVMFNPCGRSPLIAHYLHMRQLRSYDQPGKKVRRTEIVKMPSDGQTYQELINEKVNLSARLRKEYHRICESTRREIFDLEKKKMIMNREIDFLLGEINSTRNPLDIKIIGDQVLQLMDETPSPELTTPDGTSYASSSSSSFDWTNLEKDDASREGSEVKG